MLNREKAVTERENAADLLERFLFERKEAADSRDQNLVKREKAADARETASSRRDGVAQVREEAADSRESASDQREGIAQRREDAADIRQVASDHRDGLARVREEEMHVRESAASSHEKMIEDANAMRAVLEDHIASLQQTNADLITTTAQARVLTEKAQTAKDRMGHMAHHDSLTDLPNRTLLKERLDQAIAMARRHHAGLAVMFLDLDRFKGINDSLGHAVGDALLLSVAQRLKTAVRSTDTVSRYGGDEFVVLLSEISDEAAVSALAKKIRKAVGASHAIDGHDLRIGVTIGVSVYPQNGEDAESLIANADAAMYRAKRSGRDQIHFFTADMQGGVAEH